MEGLAFDCPCCGKRYADLPAVVFDGPAVTGDVDMQGADFCVLDSEHFFVRTVLTVPIIGKAMPMEWGVWSSLSGTNFQIYKDAYASTDRAALGTMFSYLGNEIPGYSGSLALRSRIHPQNDRQRPFVEFDPSQEHPLVRAQTEGITLDRAIELIMPVLHPQGRA